MSRNHHNLTAHLIDIAEKLEYAKTETKLSDLGYQPVSYSWLQPEEPKWHVNDGKKQKKLEPPPLQAVFPASRSGCSRPKSAPQRGRRETSNDHDDDHNHCGSAKTSPKKVYGAPEKLRRLLKGVTEYDAGQERLKAEREKQLRQQKLRANAPLVNKDGLPAEFDYHGHLVPKGKAVPVSRKPSADHVNTWHSPSKVKFSGQILTKTKSFIDEKKESEAQAQVEVITWRPSLLPSSTYSAGSVDDVVLPAAAFVHSWGEYSGMEEGDVMVTIEHCAGCENHSETLRHNPKRYRGLAEKFRDSFISLFSSYPLRFGVALHTYEEFDSQEGGGIPKPAGMILDVDVSRRIGSFEIQIAVQTKEQRVNHVLFSKLFRGTWPSSVAVMKATQHLLEETCGIKQLPPKSMDLPMGFSSNPVYRGDNRRHSVEVSAQEDEEAHAHARAQAAARASMRAQPSFGSMLNYIRGGSRSSFIGKRSPHGGSSHGGGGSAATGKRFSVFAPTLKPISHENRNHQELPAVTNAAVKHSVLTCISEANSGGTSSRNSRTPSPTSTSPTSAGTSTKTNSALPPALSQGVVPTLAPETISQQSNPFTGGGISIGITIPGTPSPIAAKSGVKPLSPSQMLMSLQLEEDEEDEEDDNDGAHTGCKTNAVINGSLFSCNSAAFSIDSDQTPAARHDTDAGAGTASPSALRQQPMGKFSGRLPSNSKGVHMFLSPLSTSTSIAGSALMSGVHSAVTSPSASEVGGEGEGEGEQYDGEHDHAVILHLGQNTVDGYGSGSGMMASSTALQHTEASLGVVTDMITDTTHTNINAKIIVGPGPNAENLVLAPATTTGSHPNSVLNAEDSIDVDASGSMSQYLVDDFEQSSTSVGGNGTYDTVATVGVAGM